MQAGGEFTADAACASPDSCEFATLTCPDDVEVPACASTDPADTGMASVDVEGAEIDFVDTPPNECGGAIVRTWTATFDGAELSCDQTISLDTSLSFDCPADIRVSCDASTGPDDPGELMVTSECDEEASQESLALQAEARQGPRHPNQRFGGPGKPAGWAQAGADRAYA